MPSAASSRYAQALVETLTDSAAGAQVREPGTIAAQLEAFAALLRENSELGILFATPAIAAARKQEVLKGLALRLGLEPLTRNFLRVVLEHERMNLLGEITAAFRGFWDERLGIAVADITTARPLEESEKKELAEALRARTGREVRMNFTLDRNLLGGVIARVGSTVYDGSVRGQLDRLRADLMGS